MEIIQNFDIFSVGVAVAGTFVLGFSVYFNNKESLTNKTFFLFSIITGLWGIVNYLQYKFNSPILTLWLIRFVMFFAVWQAYSIFQFFFVYPDDQKTFPAWYKFGLIPLTVVTSIISLSPLLFPSIVGEVKADAVAAVQKGPGIIVFAFVTIGLVLSGLIYFITKIIKHPKIKTDRTPSLFILFGALAIFSFIIPFNFILPGLYSNITFIPFGALFTLPFVILSAYSIFNSRIFNLRIFGISTLVFLLTVTTFFEIVLSTDIVSMILRSGVFILVLSSGLFLIRSVMKEVKQREEIEKLAGNLALTNNQLKFANDKLKELDRQKTEFVSIASHQLRSPLTAIKGYSSMLLEGSFGPIEDKARGAIDRIFDSSQKLVNVIEDFLNITRIELGRMKYEVSVFDLSKLAETVMTDQKPNVEKKGLTIDLELVPGDYQISADSGKVTQVISNIIDNSIKYTPARTGGQGGTAGWIKIKLENMKRDKGSKGKEVVRLTIADSGVGLEPETLKKLFNKFVRATDAGKTNITGTGLGLYVAKQIVEGLSGKIWAESEGKGKGSQFIVEFPHSDGKATTTKTKVEAYTKADLKKTRGK